MHTVHTSDFSDCGRERIVGHFGWNWRKPVSRTFQDWSQMDTCLQRARKRPAEKDAKCLRISSRKMVVSFLNSVCVYKQRQERFRLGFEELGDR